HTWFRGIVHRRTGRPCSRRSCRILRRTEANRESGPNLRHHSWRLCASILTRSDFVRFRTPHPVPPFHNDPPLNLDERKSFHSPQEAHAASRPSHRTTASTNRSLAPTYRGTPSAR